MSILKPVILLAMTTALTACATSYDADSTFKEAKIDSNTATIQMVKGFSDSRFSWGNRNNEKKSFYVICENECDRSKFWTRHGLEKTLSILPSDSNESELTRVTANESVEVIAGLTYPGSIGFTTEVGLRERRTACTHKLEFTPKAGKSYKVTLVEKDGRDCSLILSEVTDA